MPQKIDLEKLKKSFLQYRSFLLVIAVGLFLLMLPSKPAQQTEKTEQVSTQESFSVEEFEAKLAQTLSKIDGAGKAEVVITVKSTGMKLLARDTSKKSDGTQSSSTVTVGKGGAVQDVVEIDSYMPQFQGALIVCAGGEDPQVRLAITNAVSALTGLGADKISICKSNER